jgi:hypothetical protein
MKKTDKLTAPTTPFNLELDALLHPARAFAHPRDVVDDPDLTVNEKRAILASWMSDVCTIEAAPDLYHAPSSGRSVTADDILDALRALDRQAGDAALPWARRQVRRASIEAFRASQMGRDDGIGQGLPH